MAKAKTTTKTPTIKDHIAAFLSGQDTAIAKIGNDQAAAMAAIDQTVTDLGKKIDRGLPPADHSWLDGRFSNLEAQIAGLALVADTPAAAAAPAPTVAPVAPAPRGGWVDRLFGLRPRTSFAIVALASVVACVATIYLLGGSKGLTQQDVEAAVGKALDAKVDVIANAAKDGAGKGVVAMGVGFTDVKASLQRIESALEEDGSVSKRLTKLYDDLKVIVEAVPAEVIEAADAHVEAKKNRGEGENANTEVTPPPAPAPAPKAPVAKRRVAPPASQAQARAVEENETDGQQGYQNVGFRFGAPQSGSRARCPDGFHFSQAEGSCIRRTYVSGPSKYDVAPAQARCRLGTVHEIEVTGPNGERRKVHQTCRQ